MDDHDSTAGTAPSLDPTASAAEAPLNGSGPGTQTSAFLAELARAMHVAAGHERKRIAATVADDAAAHVDRTQARAATEIEELRRLADEDVERIHVWSASEIDRIRAEDARRTDERRADLAGYLQQHESIIATEVDGVHAAVREYRATLDAYFDALIASSDPAEIASRAGSIPPPPDLDAVRAAARSGAVARFAEPTAAEASGDDTDDTSDAAGPSATDDGADVAAAAAGVGVMDPDAIGTAAELPGEPVADEEPEAQPVGVMGPDGAAEPEEALAPVGESVSANTAVRLLRSIAPWTAPSSGEEPHDSTSLAR